MPATRDGKLWRSQFYYKDWQGVRRKKNKRGFKTKGEADEWERNFLQQQQNLADGKQPEHQHDKLESVIFTPTDWHLLRKCPCPVWMVKDQPWPEGGKALVAVNLASEENYHNTLNEKLVRETLSLAEEVNHTEVHLIGAYPVTPINIAIELPDFDPSVYNDAIRGQHLLAMKALRQKFGIDEKFTHVEKGLPEEVIPDLAEHLQAGIVVLGTVGRTGLSAAFLGNTAEQVVDHLRCDLLVLKPEAYQTPVELDDDDDD